jgi:hypothetical protein
MFENLPRIKKYQNYKILRGKTKNKTSNNIVFMNQLNEQTST